MGMLFLIKNLTGWIELTIGPWRKPVRVWKCLKIDSEVLSVSFQFTILSEFLLISRIKLTQITSKFGIDTWKNRHCIRPRDILVSVSFRAKLVSGIKKKVSAADLMWSEGQRKRGPDDQWAWVSELSKCHCYSDLWKHTENNPHCTCNLHSKVSMERHDTKGSNPVTVQGQARVRKERVGEGWRTDTSRTPRPGFHSFSSPSQVANDSHLNGEKLRVTALTISPWPDVCIQHN